MQKCSGIIILLLLLVALDLQASYKSIYTKWTKSDQVYSIDTLNATLMWNATFFSQDYIAERNQKTESLGAESYQPDGIEFMVVIYAPKDSRRFSLASDTFWKCTLITSEGRVYFPVRIDPVAVEPLQRILYPRINRWSELYHVTFDPVDLGDSFQLRLKGVTADSTLTWDVAR